MTAPKKPKLKALYLLVPLGFLTGAVLILFGVMGYMLLTLSPDAPLPSPTPNQAANLSLPTAPAQTVTPGPPQPGQVSFAAEQPIAGSSSCEGYEFRGVVMDAQGDQLSEIQVAVWENDVGLLAIDTTDTNGTYLIELDESLAEKDLWVQVYQADQPVSEPLKVRFQVDCQTGYQRYQINWRRHHP